MSFKFQCEICGKRLQENEVSVNEVLPACEKHKEEAQEKWNDFLNENGSDYTQWPTHNFYDDEI